MSLIEISFKYLFFPERWTNSCLAILWSGILKNGARERISVCTCSGEALEVAHHCATDVFHGRGNREVVVVIFVARDRSQYGKAERKQTRTSALRLVESSAAKDVRGELQ